MASGALAVRQPAGVAAPPRRGWSGWRWRGPPVLVQAYLRMPSAFSITGRISFHDGELAAISS